MNNLKVIKLRKSDLKGNIVALLKRAGLVYKNIAIPQNIFISEQDAKVMRRNTDMFTWLNLGPSELLGKAIKPGYAIVIPMDQENSETK